jgi:hypothetical protein
VMDDGGDDDYNDDTLNLLIYVRDYVCVLKTCIV